ncbi:nucleotide sugar dehydrogenase [Echinimonas agarilytica]|uniref:GDP-mannose 6-dehydrogenase n=1 Tax=Echinimonas agarilytica TaxID=1215918 RepID=A0AA41W8W5_9GAMM|nr:UDP-glucose/GDP-mannose dehydrogenase family protein [Echinimonas agarilytica]MCM2681229.1 UDP-glucose/GDP-mannose dehydrogenase family protein [Echinimonas agarilytica]
MRVSIFGMGYVGAVCTACLANRGHKVIGVDVVESKVDMINAGKSPIVEPGLGELLTAGVESGAIEATTDAMRAVAETDISFVAVPTPSQPNGNLNLEYIRLVCKDIGEAIKAKGTHHTVVIRSTVLPGSVMGVVRPVLEDYTGMRAGIDFGLAVNPEFLRESTAIDDYDHPPMTVVGCLDDVSAAQLTELYSDLDAPMFIKNIETAEMVKYTCNVWHAVKVSFANEIGSIAKASGVDGREVMDIVCTDTKLNISSYYMRPGFAFGGSCLPKDVRALSYRASQLDVKTPLLGSVMVSNENHVRNAYKLIERSGRKKVGLLGLSFKAGTDDLREAPQVELAEMLLGKGYDLKIFDANVSYAKVHGANKEHIEKKIPHISSLLHTDIKEVIDNSDFIVLGNGDKAFSEVLASINGDHEVLDLTGFMNEKSIGNKQGICW